jgi:ribosomal protein S18 acetylase RimI-like enzyme/predicted DNA-binding transcriptional regulator AlpA
MSVRSTALSRDEKRGRRTRASADVADPQYSDPLQLIRKRELARLLGINPWTLDGWRKRGLIPPPIVLSPQVVAWRRSVIATLLDERTLQPAPRRRCLSRKPEAPCALASKPFNSARRALVVEFEQPISRPSNERTVAMGKISTERKPDNRATRRIIYRIAHEHEHAAISELAKSSKFLHDFHFRVIWSPPQSYARGWIRVAECDGQIVGFISFVVKRNRTLFINHMGVHPNYRGQGIGRDLIEMVDAAVPVAGFLPKFMMLNCAKRNEEGMAFYERMGFKVVKPALKGKGFLLERSRVKPP